jgi:hypothetical protein
MKIFKKRVAEYALNRSFSSLLNPKKLNKDKKDRPHGKPFLYNFMYLIHLQLFTSTLLS